MASETPRTVNGFVVFVGSLAAFVGVTVITIAALTFNRSTGPTLEDKRAQQRTEIAAKLDKEALEKLNSAGWVDKAKGVVHAPITEVLPIVVAELRAKKPAPSQVKIDPTLPMPVIDPNATEPPPPALTSSPQGADTIRFTAPATPETAPAPVPAAAAPAPAVPEKLTPQPAVSLPASAPAVPPAPAPAPPTPTPPPTEAAPAKPAAAPAESAPAPAPAPPASAAPAPPSLTNPTENSESTK
jgi:hypothetical protein